jgi:hypothetical protein
MLLSYYVDGCYVECHICSSNAECHCDECCWVTMLMAVMLVECHIFSVMLSVTFVTVMLSVTFDTVMLSVTFVTVMLSVTFVTVMLTVAFDTAFFYCNAVCHYDERYCHIMLMFVILYATFAPVMLSVILTSVGFLC